MGAGGSRTPSRQPGPPRTYRQVVGDGGSRILEQVAAQRERLEARLALVDAMVAVASGKGGVGKSLLTANLAAGLALRGAAVGVLDADLGGPSISHLLGAAPAPLELGDLGLEPATGAAGIRVVGVNLLQAGEERPVAWQGPTDSTAVWLRSLQSTVLRELLTDTQWGRLDYLLLDTPPGAEHLPVLAQLLPGLRALLIVSIPGQLAQRTVARSILAAQELGLPLAGLVENMAGLDPDPAEDGPSMARRLGIPFLGQVPFDPRLARSAGTGRPYVLDHARTAAGRALMTLVERLQERVRGGPR